MNKCIKNGCTPRINNYGVSWCTEYGKLFPFNINHKPINKNFLTKESKLIYENYLKKIIIFGEDNL